MDRDMNDDVEQKEPVINGRTSPSRTWRLLGWSIALLLLLTPLVAMRFTEEVRWTIGDFLVFGAMLATAGMLLEWLFRLRADRAWRLAAALAVLAGFGLLWAQGAVGLVGNGNNTASLAILAGAGIALAGGLYVFGRRKARPS
jgi:hypothetical protein